MIIRRRAASLVLALVCTTIGLPASASAQPAQSCERNCLKDVLDKYLAAVLSHNAAKVAFAKSHRGTINGAVLTPGKDVWQTLTARGLSYREFFDTNTGGAAYFGQMKEGNATVIVSLRLKVEAGKVAEDEWTVGRKENSHMFDALGLERNPPPLAVPLRDEDRTPRDTMIATANAYFEGLQNSDGSTIPRIVGCDRVENGAKVTHRARGQLTGVAATIGTPAAAATRETETGDCTAGFEGFKRSITNLQPRRFPLVDEEAGVVMGTTILHRPAGNNEKRNLLTEYFYVRSGKIAGIYAAMYYLDPSAPDSPGW